MGSNGWKMRRFICPIIGIFFLLHAWRPETASANSLAIFRTSYGEMAFELFDDDKPKTVRNFIALTESGRYRNSIMHRLEPGSVVQGGGYVVQNTSSTNLATNLFLVANFGFITNEFSTGTIYSNVFGTIAMAKLPNSPDSASSQWFINLGDNSASFDTQNGGFTVFGRIVHGEQVLHTLNTKSNNYGIVNLSGFYGPPFATVPVMFDGAVFPRYTELAYPRIEILKIITTPNLDGSRNLAWNSPTGLLCRIEYRDDVSWDLLHLTNGNGLVQSVIDTNTVAAGRHYRVRIGP